MKLTDILSAEQWEAFEKELSERFKINCTVYEATGVGVTGKPNWCNRLCPEIKSNKDSLAAICAIGNQNFMAQAKQTRKPVVGQCDAGFMKIAVPIFKNDTFLGTAGGCGLLPEGEAVETFMVQKFLGLSEQEIAELSRDIGTMTDSEAEEMGAFIEARLQQLIK